MSTVKSKKLQVGTDATSSNNFTIYQPSTPDGTLRIGVGNADSPTEVGRFTSAGYKPVILGAFNAYKQGSAQLVPSGTQTKITFEVEDFDTEGWYDTSNSRFTPQVAGYYQVGAGFHFLSPDDTQYLQIMIYKNGAIHRYGDIKTASGGNNISCIQSILMYFNGTTDYAEVYISNGSASSKNIYNNKTTTYFEAILVREA